ncbi:N-acetylglucosamine-6-phosphate deacetylase [Eubacteriales bacterium OttesenSCG-928-M02]|nr:N-acetylglucosamine-6-phosphate deacetylase [Eubacteriales bacterium OttesenSCG-928-M02]
MAIHALKSKRVMDGYRSIPNGVVIIENGKIIGVGPQSRTPIPDGAQVVDYGDDIIAPGFIDIHAHGYKGISCSISPEACLEFAGYMAQHGNPTILPTASVNIPNVLAAMKTQEKDGYTGASMPVIHMEGPFLTPKNIKGYESADAHLLSPSIEKFEEFWAQAEGRIRMMGVGIELPGALDLARHMKQKGVVVACAHTRLGYDDMLKAYENGVTHATHIYNVMTGLHHRRPGIVGATLSFDGITTEMICDGLHVHPAAMEIAIRCKGVDHIAMISDLTMAGLPDGDYKRDDGREITVKDGVARAKGVDPNLDNTMSGSCFTMEYGIRTVYQVLNRPLEDAIRMATITPAKLMGLDGFTGSLEVTKDADIVIFDNDINIKETIVKGTSVYNA